MNDCGAEHINLSNIQFTPGLLDVLPSNIVHRYSVLPVYKTLERVGIAIEDPANLDAIDYLTHFLNREMELFVAEKHQLDTFIARLYPK
jgi:type IV pilus assembly protein PilB